MKLSQHVTIILCALLLWTAANSYETAIAPRAYPETLSLSYSDLPDGWMLESSADLTNWFTVILAGAEPPREFSLALTNIPHAKFFRIRTSQPAAP